MKRTMRGIFLACSIALMLGGAALCVRALIEEDYWYLPVIDVCNSRYGLTFIRDDFPSGTYLLIDWELSGFSWVARLVPTMMSYPSAAVAINIPHWILIASGAAYPVLVLIRRRRGKRGAGFPMEASHSK